MILNGREWLGYSLGNNNYFEVIRGDSVYIKDMQQGIYPYISTTEDNNGILGFVDRCNRSGNLITLAYDGTIGACFYQASPFFASEKIVTINTVQRELSENLAFFLIQILKLESKMYSYGGRKWTVEQQLKNTTVFLPATKNGDPDYDYMEQYISARDKDIKNIPDYFLTDGYKKACWYLDNIDSVRFESEFAGRLSTADIKLSDRHWDYKELQDIIPYIENGKSYNDSDLVSAVDDNYVSYVTRTDNNNGVKRYVQALDYEGLEEVNAITIGDTTATIFYQQHKFITGPHIIVLRADWMNIYTATFIISLLNREKYKYPIFGRAFTKDLIKTTSLKLPLTESGEPDYKFMEDYIKSRPFSKRL